MLRDRALYWFALWIAGQVAARDAAQSLENARGAGESILVEVETQAAAVAEGRVVVLHAANRGGGLRPLTFDVSHGHLAGGPLPRGPRALLPERGEWRPALVAGRPVRNIPGR